MSDNDLKTEYDMFFQTLHSKGTEKSIKPFLIVLFLTLIVCNGDGGIITVSTLNLLGLHIKFAILQDCRSSFTVSKKNLCKYFF